MFRHVAERLAEWVASQCAMALGLAQWHNHSANSPHIFGGMAGERSCRDEKQQAEPLERFLREGLECKGVLG